MQVTADPQGAITETSKENNEARSSHLVLPPEANQARSHVILESSFNSQNPTGKGIEVGDGDLTLSVDEGAKRALVRDD
jgi:hypothetical protein